MQKSIFTFNLISISGILLSILSAQSMEKKDNTHIHNSDLYSNTTSNLIVSLSAAALTYNHERELIREGSNGDLLIHAKDNCSCSQNTSQQTSYTKRHTSIYTNSAKTEAELLINPDNNEAKNECPLDTISNADDTELLY